MVFGIGKSKTAQPEADKQAKQPILAPPTKLKQPVKAQEIEEMEDSPDSDEEETIEEMDEDSELESPPVQNNQSEPEGMTEELLRDILMGINDDFVRLSII